MYLPFLMSGAAIAVISAASVVVVAGLIVGGILLHKHRFSSASNNLKNSYSEIHFRLSNNCETALKRLETLGKYSDFYQSIYEERKKQYQDISERKDKAIADSLASLEELVKLKDYRKIRERETEISNDLASFNKSVSDFASDLSTLLQEDDVTNSASVPVKAKHRQVESFYNEHKNELISSAPSFEFIISDSKAKIEKFQLLTNEAKYDEAKELLKDLDQVLTATVDIMDQLPLLEASVCTVLPDKISDLMMTYHQMLDENFVIDFLHVDEKVDKMNQQISELKQKITYLDVNGVKDEIDCIQSEITDLNASFEDEKNAKTNFLNAHNLMDDSTYDDERKYSKLILSLPKYQQVYILNQKYVEQMFALKTDIENIGILKRQLDSYLDTSNRQPYTLIMKKTSEMRSEMTKCERTMKDYESYIDSLKQSTEDIYQGLRETFVNIIKMRNRIRKLGIDDLLESSDFRINRYLAEIKEISDRLQVLPLDVNEIQTRYNSLHDDCEVFLTESARKLDDASKAEQAIVYTNAYRPDYTDCDSLVTQAEKAYYESDFSRAYSAAVDANHSFNKMLSAER